MWTEAVAPKEQLTYILFTLCVSFANQFSSTLNSCSVEQGDGSRVNVVGTSCGRKTMKWSAMQVISTMAKMKLQVAEVLQRT